MGFVRGCLFCISIHALLAESDPPVREIIQWEGIFLSTLSLRRATHYDNYNLHCVEISIHALLAESDSATKGALPLWSGISIHALLAESDLMKERTINWHQFLSTLSLRRATRP